MNKAMATRDLETEEGFLMHLSDVLVNDKVFEPSSLMNVKLVKAAGKIAELREKIEDLEVELSLD